MSLKGFHVFFIAVCLALTAGLGAWGVRDYQLTAERASLILGCGSFATFAVLGVYGAWFLRKLRGVSYV